MRIIINALIIGLVIVAVFEIAARLKLMQRDVPDSARPTDAVVTFP